jgi:hypothetical protein
MTPSDEKGGDNPLEKIIPAAGEKAELLKKRTRRFLSKLENLSPEECFDRLTKLLYLLILFLGVPYLLYVLICFLKMTG